MPEGKKDDDIVGRLEALRKKIPAEKKGVPAPAPAAPTPAVPVAPEEEPDKRKKLARIIGIVIILIIVGVVATVGMKIIPIGKEKDGAKTAEAQKAAAEAQKAAAEARKAEEERKTAEAKLAVEEVARLKSVKLNKTKEIRDAFKDTPSDLDAEKQKVLDLIESAETFQQVEAIDANSSADDAWDAVLGQIIDKEKAVDENVAIESVKEKIREILGVDELTELRGLLIQKAVEHVKNT